ncbi:hypothetical protein [Chromobacterium haemolyticum]|uniref:hypothetical protein n=1 Tax=Chromobacterium haemolyticum TaxID=394935 RepID=UPI0009F14BAF|nr:hypothetical protein [Chromobacterium haemolyticum]OQS44579.1 hypothetical protein B0T39_02275 [Chromobacterium haemolyticum]
MDINFEVIIQSHEEEVDMDYALETLSGTASVTCLLAEAILEQKVIDRRTSANNIRARLKQSFRGSYGQNFSIHITNSKLQRQVIKIGKPVIAEVMSYYIHEALYANDRKISQDAENVIKSLKEIEDRIVKKIKSPLKKMHKITSTNGYDISLNCRPKGDNIPIAYLNKSTSDIIMLTEKSPQPIIISAVITRFNSRTGNGRLIIENQEGGLTTPFNFDSPLETIPTDMKKKVTENLHLNNGRDEERFEFIQLLAHGIKNSDNTTIKFLIVAGPRHEKQ